MVWCEETILRLREMWEQGHSTAEIGRRLGVSKNAIVGKAHRLDLSARPSPIRREPMERTNERLASCHRPVGPTLPPLPSAIDPPPTRALTGSSSQGPFAGQSAGQSHGMAHIQALRAAPAVPVMVPKPPVPAVAPPLRAVAPPPAQPRRSAPACCWPIGEPGKKDFRFCDDVSVPGKPYCEEHARVAYVRIRDRKEDAA